MPSIRQDVCDLNIGGDVIFGIGPECGPCKQSENLTYFAINEGSPGQFQEIKEIPASIGRRERRVALKVTEQGTRGSITGSMYHSTFEILKSSIMGDITTTTPSIVTGNAGEYDHLNSVTQDACPPSYTLIFESSKRQNVITGAVVTSLEISGSAGDVIEYTMNFEGSFPYEDPLLPPSVILQEKDWETKDLCVFVDDTIADIDAHILAGTAEDEIKLCLTEFTITFENQVNSRVCMGDTLDCSNKIIYFGSFDVTGSFTAPCTSPENYDNWTAGNRRAMKFVLIDSDVTMAGGGNPTFTIDVASWGISGWTENSTSGELVTESIDWLGFLDIGLGYMTQSTITNEEDGTMYFPVNCI